jgi:ERCC4-type nuclease
MILIDDRVGSRELAPLLRARGASVELARLDSADFAWQGNGPDGMVLVGVERKTIGDLLSCIVSGRLKEQLVTMHETYQERWLLVEGRYREGASGVLEILHHNCWTQVPWGKRVWMYSTVEGFLLTLIVQGGMLVKNVEDLAQSASWLRRHYGWWQGAYNDHGSLHTFHVERPVDQVALVRPGLVRRMAKELDGIGWDKSIPISRHFRTPLEMCMAGEKEWRSIEGIGKKLAASIVRMLQGG